MATDVSKLIDYLDSAAAGDRLAFEKLYDATSAKLFGVILRILKDQTIAEEVLQDVYVKIWRQAHSFDARRASPITWMATIARNSAIDEVRRSSRHTQPPDYDFDAIPDGAPAQDAALIATELGTRLERCLQALEARHRDIVKLAYLEGLSREDLSERFGLPLGTVKTWLRRSLQRLKECLVE